MSYIFVKSSYSKKTNGTKIDGIELEFGETAFASLAEAAKKAEAGDTVVVLDSKALSDGINLEGIDIITAYDEVYIDNKINLTAKGSLVVDDSTLGNIGKTADDRAIGFQNVTVQNASTVGDLLGGKISAEESHKEDWDKDTETDINNSNKTAAGKLVVEESEIGAADGYATVELNAATAAGITGGSSKSNNKHDEKGAVTTITDSKDKKAAGKLTAVESEVDGDIKRYATVELSKGSSVGGNIIGGNETFSSQTNNDDKKETYVTKESKKFAAAGKVVVDDSDVAGNISGYSDVKIAGKEASVGVIDAQSYEYSYSSDDKKDTVKTSKKYAIKAAGKLAVEDATIAGAQGFANVTLDGATVDGSIDAFGEVAFGSDVVEQVDDYTDYTETLNADADKAVVKETKKIASTGKLTAADSTFAGANGFATVDVKDSKEVTGDITKEDKTVVTETTVDADDVVTVKTTTTNKLGGTAKFANVKGGANVDGSANVDGYAKVTVEKASVLGNISNETRSKIATTEVDDVVVASELKAAANGSIDIKTSKVGDVSGFKAVTVAGKKGKADETVVASISTGVDDNVVDSKMSNSIKPVDGDLYTAYNGKYDFAETQKADGTVKVTDATVTGAITGYKDVTLTNAAAGAIDAGENEVEKKSYTVKTVEKKEKDEDGSVAVWGEITVSSTESEVVSKGGKFTATHSTFGAVSGYSEVKLTDIKEVGDVTGTLETKDNSKYTRVLKADDFAAISGSSNDSYSEKSVGSFNFAVKDMAKGADLVEATVGNIADFNKVTVAGVAAEYKRIGKEEYEVTDEGLNVTTGAISDNGSYSVTETSKYINDDGKAQGQEYTDTFKESYAATGSVAISDNVGVDGNIEGFKTVSITGNASEIDGANDTVIDGDIFAYNTQFFKDKYQEEYEDEDKRKFAVYSYSKSDTYKEKFAVDKDGERDTIASISGKNSETESGKAAGSITVDAADVTGSIVGFDKVTVTDAAIDGNISRGTDWTSKYDETISTKGEQVTITDKTSSTETAAGSVKVVDSTVGAINDYAKVELVDSNAGAISINNKVVFNSSETYIYDDIEDYYDDPGMDADEHKVTSKTVATAIGTVKVSVTADKAEEMFENKLPNFVTVGGITGAKSVTLSGIAHDLDKDQIAYVVSGGIAGGNVEITYNADDKEAERVFNATSAGSVDAKYAAINGDISSFDKVTLTDSFVNGSVTGGKSVTTDIDNGEEITQEITASGSLKAVNTDIAGAISGFAKVELDNVAGVAAINGASGVIVDGEIEEIGSKATLKMVDSEAGVVNYFKSATVENSEIGAVAEVESFTAAKGIVEVGAFFGGEEIDTTLTISKDAVMTIGSFSDDELDFAEFGDKGDKLAINGTLVVGDAVNDNGELDILEIASGNGTIALNKDAYDAVKEELDDFKGSFINLGNTANGFRGAEYEKADDVAKGAVEIDLEDGYTGWLGAKVEGDDKNVEINFIDKVDYIEFTIEEGDAAIGQSLTIDGVVVTIEKFSGEGEAALDNLVAGDYLLKLERQEENSVSYNIALA